MKPILSIKDLSYSYHTLTGETAALTDIDMDIMPGEFISIVGPSGCGKSTLLSLICGLLQPDSGKIIIPENTNIGYMLQKDNLFEWRSIYSNILLGLEIQKKNTPKARERIEKMLDLYGLADFKKSKPSQLSGGMRQRAALIRTLALEPDILLLDEPFSALDYQTRLTVSNDIGSIIKSQQKTAILVTHDIAEAIAMGDKIYVLSKRPGRIANIIPVNLSVNNRTPFNSRSAPEFNYYFNIIWEELNHES